MAQTTVLITGANRGLGKGLLERYLLLPNYIVIAANRDPSHPTSKALNNLSKHDSSRLIIVKIDASIEKDAFNAVKELQEKHGIDHLDVVIPNAGISSVWPAVMDLKLEDLKEHMEINAYSVVALYQATRSLLKNSTKEAVFAPMGSQAGFINKQPPIPNGAYGPSKAVVNWLIVRITAEEEWLNAFVLDPGLAQTDLGNAGARHFGMTEAPTTVADSCDGLMKALVDASREMHGGRMISFDGTIHEW